MNPAEALSSRLLGCGYEKVGDGTFLATDRRRVVVIMEASEEPGSWPKQVSEALQQSPVARLPAWARYVVLVHPVAVPVGRRSAAAAFSRDVTKCRRLHVYPDSSADVTRPFLPLDAGMEAKVRAPEVDVRQRIFLHLDPVVAEAFADSEETIVGVEHLIGRSIGL